MDTRLRKERRDFRQPDKASDLLADLDPRSTTFLSEATAASAILIRGEGSWAASMRSLLTAAIIGRSMEAARANRRLSLSDVSDVLLETAVRTRMMIDGSNWQRRENDRHEP